jgi:hypothetical protein
VGGDGGAVMLIHGAAVPGFLSEVPELPLGEQIDLGVVDGDTRAAAPTVVSPSLQVEVKIDY